MRKKLLLTIPIAALLLTFIVMNVSCSNINAVEDPHFTSDGELVEKPELFSVKQPQQINFYIEVSGSMNGFFRGNYPTKLKKDVYNIMSQLSSLSGEVKLLSNGGTIDRKMSIDDFRNIMNAGSFASTASTDMPTMLKTIINDIDSGKTAVLISDMVYSPVGNAAPEVLLTQYSADIAKIFGSAQKAVCLISATSEFLDKSGNISVKESPYYYLIIGEPENVAFVRNTISSLLELNETFVDNIESGFDYKQASYDFGKSPINAIKLDNQPTYYDYDEEAGPCEINLKVNISNYRWLIADKDAFLKCFNINKSYGSVMKIDSVEINVDNFDQKQMKRNAYADVKIKISNMPQDVEVLEWWIDTDNIDTDTTFLSRFFGATDESDRTKSYSIDNFIKGIFQGGIVNKSSDKHNYILISKIS